MENQNPVAPESDTADELAPVEIMHQFVKIYSQYVRKCAEAEKYQSELERVQLKLSQKESALMEQTSQNETLRIRMEMLNAENQKLERSVQEFQNQYSTAIDKMAGFSEIYRQTEQSMQYYDKQSIELSQKLKELEPSPVLTEKLRDAQKKLEETQETAYQYQQEAEQLQAENKKLKTEIISLKEQLTLKTMAQNRQPSSEEDTRPSEPPQTGVSLQTLLNAAGGMAAAGTDKKSRQSRADDFNIDVSIEDFGTAANGTPPKSADDALKMLFGI